MHGGEQGGGLTTARASWEPRDVASCSAFPVTLGLLSAADIKVVGTKKPPASLIHSPENTGRFVSGGNRK